MFEVEFKNDFFIAFYLRQSFDDHLCFKKHENIWGKGKWSEQKQKFLTSWSRRRTKIGRIRNTGFLLVYIQYGIPKVVNFWHLPSLWSSNHLLFCPLSYSTNFLFFLLCKTLKHAASVGLRAK
jgi:hypothetical protein